MQQKIRFQILGAVLMMMAMPLSHSVAQENQTDGQVCSTGPYRFDGTAEVATEFRPSSARQISALGLLAAREGCTIRLVCPVRASTDAEDETLAKRESFRHCWNVRTTLLKTQTRSRTPLSAQFNKALRDEIKIGRENESAEFPVGAVMIYLSN